MASAICSTGASQVSGTSQDTNGCSGDRATPALSSLIAGTRSSALRSLPMCRRFGRPRATLWNTWDHGVPHAVEHGQRGCFSQELRYGDGALWLTQDRDPLEGLAWGAWPGPALNADPGAKKGAEFPNGQSSTIPELLAHCKLACNLQINITDEDYFPKNISFTCLKTHAICFDATR